MAKKLEKRAGKMTGEKFMQMALDLAEKAAGRTSPNPLVGCVIVKNGRVMGKGYHRKVGGGHAEINALRQAGTSAKNATMYVSLEPCCHYGRTGPCTKAIIKAGIKKVVAAMQDPNQAVNGKGLKELRKNGIKTAKGILEKEARRLNEFYVKHSETGMPFVLMKAGMSLDGKIGYGDGKRKRITGRESLRLTHKLRSRVDAVLVGVNTVLKDNPRLTARIGKGKNPVRVIADSKARTPLNARLLREHARVVIACTKLAGKKKIKKLEGAGTEVIVVKEKNGCVGLKSLVRRLGKMGITSVMIEGGAAIFASAVREGIIDRALFFISPKIIGKGLGVFGEEKLMKKLETVSVKRVGKDLLVEAKISGGKAG